MSILSSMDMPTMEVDLGPERIPGEKVEVGGPLIYCDLCDTEVVHKLAQMLLPGLATACVDCTSGDLFKTPGSVAVDLRKEIIDYVTHRTELFVAESVILEGGPDGKESEHPFDIISNFVDDFASSKSNLFTKVSGWLLSDKREDKIDDFIQEMEMNNFWALDRREKVAETFLKNVDFDNKFHCGAKFNSADELVNHALHCNFRTVICENEGCNARFTAGHLEKHDSTCPFKIIQCEQKCSDTIMRRHMDRHCITVCPMKLVNCPFYAVGCRSAIAQCLLDKHRSDDIGSHLWHLLKGKYKEVSGEDLQRRVEKILQASSVSRLAEARDVRSLNSIVKDIEAKLGPIEVTVKRDSAETIAKNDGEGGEINTKGSEPSAETVAKKDDGDSITKDSEPSAETAAKKDDGDSITKDSGPSAETVAKKDDVNSNTQGSELSAETVAKKDDGDNNKKGSEPSTKAPDMMNSSDRVEESDVVNMDSSRNIVMPGLLHSSDKAEASDTINMDKSVNTAIQDVVISSDKVSDIANMDSSENTFKKKDEHSHIESSSENSPKNKDGKHRHTESISENSPKNKENEYSHIESRGRVSEENTQIPNMDSIPNEPEVSIVNKDSAQVYSQDKDIAAGDFKIDGDEDSTRTNMGSDIGEIGATNVDGAEKKKKHAKGSGSSISSSDSSSGDDKHNEERKDKQKRKMKNKGNEEHNVKNKDIEDDDFKDCLEEDSEV